MIWDETRWENKIKEKWGKYDPEEAIAGNIEDYLERIGRGSDDSDGRYDERAA
jgi:hypothetical protein